MYTKFHANPSRKIEVTRGDKHTDKDFYYIDVRQLFLGEMEVDTTKKRTAEEGEESNDGSRRSTSPEPAKKKKKIDPVSDDKRTLLQQESPR